MIGGVNGVGGTTHDYEQLMCFGVPPAPVYKGGGEEAGHKGRAKEGGVLLGVPVLVGFAPPPFPIPTRRRGKEEEERRKGGRPPTLVQFGLGLGGRTPPPGRCLLSPLGPMKAH